MSISSIASTAVRATLQAATDAVTNSPFIVGSVVAGGAAIGYYVVKKKHDRKVAQEQAVRRTAEAEQRERKFTEKPASAKKPAPAPVQPEPPKQETQQSPKDAEQLKQEETRKEEEAKVFTEEALYSMKPEEMLKKPKIQKIYQAFEEAHGQDFPTDLTAATDALTNEAHMRMADLINKSRSFETEKMRHDDLLSMARSTAANARLSQRYTNRIHSTRTFKGVTKVESKLLLALLGTAVKRDHAEHMPGTEAKGMTEAIALLDECYARGVTAVYFYETLVFDAPEERERQLIEHQVRIMIDMMDETFTQTVVF